MKDKQRQALEAIDKVKSAWPDEVTVMLTHEQRETIREALSTDSRSGECNVDNQPINEKLKAIMDAPTPFTPAADEVVVKRVELEKAIYAIGKAFAFMVPASVPSVYAREAHKILEHALEVK